MTNAFLTRRRLIGFALIVFAFLPHGAALWHANRYNWTPLNFRTQLRQGEIRTPTFTADVDGRYVLWLELLPRMLDKDRMDCLLGFDFARTNKCAAIPSVVKVSWVLFDGPRPVADETSLQTWVGGSFANDYIRREIGRFELMRGEHYTLVLQFDSDPSELNIAQPKIVAEAMRDMDGYAIEVQFSFYLGILVVTVGLVLVARGTRRHRGSH